MMNTIESNKNKTANLEETIYKRQSVRTYEETSLSEDTIKEIKSFINETKVLNENIAWSYDIVDKDMISTMLRWKAPHYILLFSEEKENYKENIGFIFQQVELYLQSRGIGACWIGLASPSKNYVKKHNNQEYIIMISIGNVSGEIYRQTADFQRNSLTEISDNVDEKLKPIQYAPSAGNTQTWYITHNDDGTYNIYRKKLGLLKRRLFGKFAPLDIGIGLAHLYLANPTTFNFYFDENHKEKKNCYYEGTFKI